MIQKAKDNDLEQVKTLLRRLEEEPVVGTPVEPAAPIVTVVPRLDPGFPNRAHNDSAGTQIAASPARTSPQPAAAAPTPAAVIERPPTRISPQASIAAKQSLSLGSMLRRRFFGHLILRFRRKYWLVTVSRRARARC